MTASRPGHRSRTLRQLANSSPMDDASPLHVSDVIVALHWLERFKIIEQLAVKPLTRAELASRTQLSSAAARAHLEAMQRASLVQSTLDGRQRLWSLGSHVSVSTLDTGERCIAVQCDDQQYVQFTMAS